MPLFGSLVLHPLTIPLTLLLAAHSAIVDWLQGEGLVYQTIDGCFRATIPEHEELRP